MPNPIPTGLVGFGFGGRIFHAPFIHATPGLDLAAVMQRSSSSAADEYPAAHIFHSTEELLADAAIRLVTVCTPNQSHFAVARQCLLAGRHVVVDKPLTITSDEAEELVALAAERNLHVFTFQNRRWDGDFLTIRELLNSGELGRLVLYEARWDRFRPIPRAGTWKETDPGAGMLLDLGTHLADQVLALFGLPQSVTGEVTTDRDGSAIEDGFHITFHYAKDGPHRGLRARITTSFVAAEPAPRFALYGTHGSFVKYGLDAQESALIAGRRPPQSDSAAPWLAEPESAWGTLTTAADISQPANLSERRVPTLPGDYRNFYAAVRDCILGLPNSAVTGADGLRVIRMLELARESSDTGRTLPIPQSW